MPLTVRKFNAQVKDPQSGQMVPAGLLSSDSLQAIEAAESAAITEIQQKGAQTKADIPDDYTELSDSVGELKTHKEDKYEEVTETGFALDKFDICPTYYSIVTFDDTPAIQFSSFSDSGNTWIWSKLEKKYADITFKVNYGMFSETSPNTRLVIAATDSNALALILNKESENVHFYSATQALNRTAYVRNADCRAIAVGDTLHCVNNNGKIAVYLVDEGQEIPLFASEYIDVLAVYGMDGFTADDIGFGIVSNNSGRGTPLIYDFSAKLEQGIRYMTYAEGMEEINGLEASKISKQLYLAKNLLDTNTMENGYIDASGYPHSGNGLKYTDFIPVNGSHVYCYNPVYNQYFAFYDENKAPIATYSTLSAMTKVYGTNLLFDCPILQGAAYFRCTYSTGNIDGAWISLTAEKPYAIDKYSVDAVFPETMNPANPCDYSELSIRTFHKIACIGDSITYGGMNYSVPTGGVSPVNVNLSQWYSYPTKLKEITGVETTNFGTSGLDSEQWYDAYKDTDFSGYDCAIIHLGINDSAHHITDEATITAIGNIITMLKSASKDIRIFVCNVIAAYDGEGYQAKGNLIKNYAASLNDPYVIPLDLAAYSHVRPLTSYVAGHLTALGYYMMAYDLARYISWYIDHNKRNFQFVQFIGTDAVYP